MFCRLTGRAMLAVALLFAVVPTLLPHPAQARSSDDDPDQAERRANAKRVREAAEAGDVKAQVLLGLMHARGGAGVRHSYKDALKWWQEASNHGSARATYFLGELYRIGKGVDQDDEMAVKLYRQAADRNDAPAETALGRAYITGEGVAKNVKLGLDWVNKAAAQNDSGALAELGFLRLTGEGLPRDSKEAAKLFLAAAEMGHGGAQFSYAILLEKGEGVARDDRAALMWALLADDRDIKGADKEAEHIAARLSPADRAEAERQAKAWRPHKAGDVDTGGDLAANDKGEDEDGAKAPAPAPSAGGALRLYATGTGFFVSDAGHLLTNHHVIEGCTRLDVGTAASGMSPAQVVADDARNDLAVLKLATPSKTVAAFRAGQVRQAEMVMAYGFPLTGALATDGNATTGNITALAGLGDDTRFYQTSAPVQHGNSGGPLLDASGNVVGVVSSGLVGRSAADVPQNVNFAIKSSVVTNFLESHGIAYGTSPLGAAKSPPDISDLAKGFTALVNCMK